MVTRVSHAAESHAVAFSSAQAQAAGVRTQAVQMASAGSGAAPLTLNGTVVLPPQALQTLSAPLAGFVQQVLVGPTDAVKAGQVVARLHSSELLQWQREYVQASAQAKAAGDRLQRSERLFAEGIVAEARVREDRYAHTQAQVALTERRQALRLAGVGDAQIAQLGSGALLTQIPVVAPRAGTVMEVLASPGQRLEAGAPVATLAHGGLLALELQASAEQASQIAPGAVVQVAGCAQSGRVKGIATQVRGGNQALVVHAELPANSPCVRPNQAVRAEVSSSNVNTALAGIQKLATVPIASVVRQQGKDYVFVQTPSGFTATEVQVPSRSTAVASVAPVTGAPFTAQTRVAVLGLAAIKGAWLGMGEPESSPASAAPAAAASGKR